jgi:hypothetical protein
MDIKADWHGLAMTFADDATRCEDQGIHFLSFAPLGENDIVVMMISCIAREQILEGLSKKDKWQYTQCAWMQRLNSARAKRGAARLPTG